MVSAGHGGAVGVLFQLLEVLTMVVSIKWSQLHPLSSVYFHGSWHCHSWFVCYPWGESCWQSLKQCKRCRNDSGQRLLSKRKQLMWKWPCKIIHKFQHSACSTTFLREDPLKKITRITMLMSPNLNVQNSLSRNHFNFLKITGHVSRGHPFFRLRSRHAAGTGAADPSGTGAAGAREIREAAHHDAAATCESRGEEEHALDPTVAKPRRLDMDRTGEQLGEDQGISLGTLRKVRFCESKRWKSQELFGSWVSSERERHRVGQLRPHQTTAISSW